MMNDKTYDDLCKKYKAPIMISYEWRDYWEKAIAWSIHNNRLDFLKELVINYPKQESINALLEKERDFVLTSSYQRTTGKKILSYLIEKVSIPSSGFVIGKSITALIERNKLVLLDFLIEKAQESNIENINEIILEHLVVGKSYEMINKFLKQQKKKNIIIKNEYEEHLNIIKSDYILKNNILDKVIKTKNLSICKEVYKYFDEVSDLLNEAELVRLIKDASYENAFEVLDFLLKELFKKNPNYNDNYNENSNLVRIRPNLNVDDFLKILEVFTTNNIKIDGNINILMYLEKLLNQEKIDDSLKFLENFNVGENIKKGMLKEIIYSKILSLENKIKLIDKLNIKSLSSYEERIMNNLYWGDELGKQLGAELIKIYISKDYFKNNEDIIYKTLEAFLRNKNTENFISCKNYLDDLITDKLRLIECAIANKNMEALNYLNIAKDNNIELELFNIIHKRLNCLTNEFSQKIIEKYMSFTFLNKEENNNILALVVESLLVNNKKEKSIELLTKIPLLSDIDKVRLIKRLFLKEEELDTIKYLNLIKYKEMKNYEAIIIDHLHLSNNFNTVYGEKIIDNCISLEFLNSEYINTHLNKENKTWITTLKLKRELSKESDSINKPNKKIKM